MWVVRVHKCSDMIDETEGLLLCAGTSQDFLGSRKTHRIRHIKGMLTSVNEPNGQAIC